MVREILKDVFIFKKAQPATAEDISVARDLADTLAANREICLGLAANMIGENKRIIAFFDGEKIVVMLNPQITKKSAASYWTSEGCLSLSGVRKALRNNEITVEYRDVNFKPRRKKYLGLTAQIIQHETDHCDGIVI